MQLRLFRWSRFLVVLVALIGATAVDARAEIVRLSSGKMLVVDECRFEADAVVLVMRGGGMIRVGRDIVVELLPDEIPFARAVAIERLAGSVAAQAPPLAPGALRALIDRIAAKVGLDGKLAHAVIQAESNYDQRAVSPKGAMGLMQIMPVIQQQYLVKDPFDPEMNLEAGMRHLRALLGRFDVRRALAAYNAGETAVTRYGGVPPYRETQTYVARIMAALR